MALVNQDPVLFSGSIRDNIAYGLSHCSMDEIQEAARKANAHDFILKLKDGYNTGKNVRLPVQWNIYGYVKHEDKHTNMYLKAGVGSAFICLSSRLIVEMHIALI